MSRVVAIVQARMGSSRLPGKVLADLAGRPLLVHVLERVRSVTGVDEVIVATTTRPEDDLILACARSVRVRGIAGSEDDVLDRYVKAARQTAADVIMRITADCPLLDPQISESVLRRLSTEFDYVSNTGPPTYPDGLDTEVFSAETLERAVREATLASDREHVTPYIWKHPDLFRIANVRCDRNLSGLRWTVDEPQDLVFVRAIYERLHGAQRSPFTMQQVLALLEEEPSLNRINSGLSRNQGYARSVERDAHDQRGGAWPPPRSL